MVEFMLAILSALQVIHKENVAILSMIDTSDNMKKACDNFDKAFYKALDGVVVMKDNKGEQK